MSDYDEYGAPDGECVDCGAATEADYHWRCKPCYAIEQGWTPRGDADDPGELRKQHVERQSTSLLALVERVAELERRATASERRAEQLAALWRAAVGGRDE